MVFELMISLVVNKVVVVEKFLHTMLSYAYILSVTLYSIKWFKAKPTTFTHTKK